MVIRHLVCPFLLLSHSFSLSAQSINASDSIAYYFSQIEEVRDSSPPKAIELARYAIAFAVKSDDISQQINILKLIGEIESESGNFQHTIENYVKALKLAEAEHLKHEQAMLESVIARTYVTLKKYILASEYASNALKLSREIGDSLVMARALNIHGNIAEKDSAYVEAEYRYCEALSIYEALHYHEGIAIEKNNLGNIYKGQKKFAEAIRYYQEALQIDSVLGGENQDFYYNNIGGVYADQGDYQQALQYGLTALKLAQNRAKDFSSFINIYSQLTRSYTGLKDYESALHYNSLYVDLLTTSINENSMKRISEIQAVYENEKKQAEIDVLHIAEQSRITSIRQQKVLRNGLIAGFLLLSLFTYLLYRNNREKQRTNEVLKEKNRQIEDQKNEIANNSLELENLNRIKDKLFSIISHDFRNPLNNLLQVLTLSDEGVMEKKKLEFYLKALKDDVRHTSGFLDNLLLWAKSQMKGIKPRFTVLDLKLLADDTVRLLQTSADEKRITLRNEINSQVLINGDLEMLKLVIRNLISNAIKFCSFNDHITINGQSNGSYVTVSIEDTGIGMPEEKLDTLFTAEVNSSLGTKGEAGTGLGLMLCREFVVLHGGMIKAESVIGTGSRFYFTVPKA